jgi:hypothetical protein
MGYLPPRHLVDHDHARSHENQDERGDRFGQVFFHAFDWLAEEWATGALS